MRHVASCVFFFDRDVCKFVTLRDTFRCGCTGVMPIAKTRGMRSCISHDFVSCRSETSSLDKQGLCAR